MSDHREALDHILALCNQSRTYSRRIQTIHEVAMVALGMTAGQRVARHERIIQRTGGEAALAAYHARQEKRRLKNEECDSAREAA